MKKTLNRGILLFALLLLLSFAAFAVDTDPTNPTTSYDPTVPTVPTVSTEPTTEPTGDHYADRAAVATVIKAIQNTRATQNDVTIHLAETSEIYKIEESFGLIPQSDLNDMIANSATSFEEEFAFSNGVGNVEQVNEEGATETVETSLSEFFVPASENSDFYNLLSGDFVRYVSNVTESHSEKGTQIAFTLSNMGFVLVNGRSLAATWAKVNNLNGIANPSTTYNAVRISALINNNNHIQTIEVKTDVVLSGSITTDWGNDRISFSYSLNEAAEFTYSDDETGDPETPTIRTGYCGDSATYVLNLTTGVLEISGTGHIYDSFFANNKTIQNVIINDGITGIGNGVFHNCTNIKSISIPVSASYFGQNILSGCSRLEIMVAPFWGNTTYSGGSFPLGYYFGTQSFVDAERVYQYYQSSYYYVPKALHTVNVIGTPSLDGTFRNCQNIKNVVISDQTNDIPHPVTFLGKEAFAGCFSLKSVSLPESLYSISSGAFLDCSALEEISIPSAVTRIGNDAFAGCESLRSIKLPDSLERIESGTFISCTSLQTVVFPEQLDSIGASAFEKCGSLESLTLPDSVTRIEKRAFNMCTSLKIITLPNNLAYCDNDILSGCNSLETLVCSLYIHKQSNREYYYPIGYYFGYYTFGDGYYIASQNYTWRYTYKSYLYSTSGNYSIPNSLTTVIIRGENCPVGALMNCTSVTNVTVPDGVRRISKRAFYGCSGLETIILPKSVKVIDPEAFRDCVNLRAVGFAADPASGVPDETTADSKLKLIAANAFRNCNALTEMTVPYYVGTIGEQAFYDCDALQKVVFAERDGGTTAELPRTKLQTIGGAAFGRCELLENVNLPFHVTSIGRKAFIGDIGLTKITIPGYVETIGAYAFLNCRNVSEIEYCAKAVNSVERFYSYYYDKQEGVYKYRTNKYHPFYQVGADTDGLTVTFTDTVRKVPDRLFYKNTALKKLVISAKVTDIGNYSFSRCENLNKIVYQTGTDETTAQPVSIALSHIGCRAFSHCASLRSLYIPASVKTIDSYAFSNCVKVGTIYYKAKAMNRSRWDGTVFDSVGADANGLTLVVCNTVRAVPAKLMYNNLALQRLSVSQRVGTIGGSAFEGCKNLNEVTFAAAVRRTLTDLSFTRLTEIGARAFARCAALERIDIPESVSVIGDAAFAGCSALKQVHFGTKDTATGTDVSRSRLYEIATGTFRKCYAMESIIIPDSVEQIGWNAFKDCTHLKNVYFGSIENTAQNAQLQSIGGYAFHNCKRMNWFKFPQTVSTIGSGAFKNCRSLRKLNLPESVSTVQGGAFNGCTRLKRITISNASCVIDYQSTTFPKNAILYAYSNHSSAKAYTILFVREFRLLHCDSHTTNEQPEIPAKCTEEGYTAGIYCEECETWIEGHDAIPAHGHRYVVASQIPATDTQEAALLYVCTYDHSHLLYEPIGSDHQPGAPVIENEVPATCTTPGSYDSVIYCTDCGKELSRSSVATAKAPHTPGTEERKNEVAPTCQKDGKVTLITYCAVCGGVMKTEQLVLPKSGHTPSTPVREKEVPATASTYGSYEEVTYCSVCGIEMSREVKSIAPLNHEHQYVPTETVPATCTKEGRQTLTCSICGDAKTETLPKADHVDTDNDGYCDTCEQLMTGGDHCKYCGQIHGGAFGWLTKFFHSILALFGARK